MDWVATGRRCGSGVFCSLSIIASNIVKSGVATTFFFGFFLGAFKTCSPEATPPLIRKSGVSTSIADGPACGVVIGRPLGGLIGVACRVSSCC